MAGKPKYVVELEERINALEARITQLESAPAAPVNTSVEIVQNGKKVSNRMISTLVRMGDFETFAEAHAAAVQGFAVAARLDEWSACFPTVKRFHCSDRSHYHYDRDEARACAMNLAPSK